MDIGLPKQQSDLPDSISSPYAVWVRDSLEVAYEQVRRYSGQVVQRQKRLYDRGVVRRLFAVGDWVLRYYTPAKKCKLEHGFALIWLCRSPAGRLEYKGTKIHQSSWYIAKISRKSHSHRVRCHI